MLRYFQRSIYRKLLLSYLFIAVFTISILMTDFYFRTAEDLKRQSIDSTERLAQQSAATLESYMGNVRSFAWNYFGDASFQQFVLQMGTDPDSLSYYSSKINQFTTDNPAVSSLIVNKLNGFSVQAGADANGVAEDERLRLTNIATRQEGKGVWVPSQVYDRDSKATVTTLSFVQAIRKISISSPGPTIGVMLYGLSYSYLQNWLQEVGGSGGSVFAIVRSADGSVVEAPRKVDADRLALRQNELASVAKNQSSGHFYSRDPGGTTLIVYQKLPGTDWMLVSRSPTRVLMKPVNDFTRRTVLVGALSLLVSMLLATFLSSRTITPLKELSKGMKAIEVGNYDVSLAVRSIDEVGYLSSSFNRMAVEIKRLIRKVYETELVKKNAEIKALQSQINPHFLYNTLGIIDSLSSMNGDERVSLISRSLAKMFRYNISGDDISTLKAEIQQIRLYLSIQHIRFDSRLSYTTYLEPGLEDAPIPKLLFQPLVENSILHGISRSVEGGTIRIEATRSESGDRIRVRVWNNGAPIDGERQIWIRRMLRSSARNGENYAERTSVGLLNVHSRIRMVYGGSCGIDFDSSAERGTEFTLTIKPTLPAGGNEIEHYRA
jgi:two-component system sensor histidine kinase YesM